jgi:hypothetical protein
MSRARGGWDGAIDTAHAVLQLVRTMFHRPGWVSMHIDNYWTGREISHATGSLVLRV